MAEEAQQVTPQINIINQYVRDLSFENIAAQKGMGGELRPEVSVQVNLDAKARGESQYEVILRLTVNAKSDDTQVFLVELDYGGIFSIKNVPEEQIHAVLMIECPRILFPFARRIVHTATTDGGFPPLNVDMIDFMALYRSEIERRMASKEAEGAKVN